MVILSACGALRPDHCPDLARTAQAALPYLTATMARKGRITSLAVIDLDQIAGAADWARVVLGVGGSGIKPLRYFLCLVTF